MLTQINTCQNTKKGAIMTQQKEIYPLLSQLINFIQYWERNSNTQLQFNQVSEVKLTEVITILDSPRLASGPGLCYNLTILEHFLKKTNILDDRVSFGKTSFRHPSKSKLYMYCLGKTDLKKLA